MTTYQQRPLCDVFAVIERHPPSLRETKLAESVRYLRDRNICVSDPANKFRYTRSEETDIRRTYRANAPRQNPPF